jgi:MscS family membrane protein
MHIPNRGFRSQIATFLLVIVAAGVGASQSLAQETVLLKAADTSSPRDTLRSFIDACNELNDLIHREKYFDRTNTEHFNVAQRILDCIDMSELPAFAREDRASEVATCIKEILDRVQLPDWDQIPDTEEIEKAGGYEKLSTWRIPGTRITIARVDEGPQKHEYLFSPGTVDRAVGYFKSIESKPYRTTGPATSEGFFRWYMSAPGHPVLARVYAQLPEYAQHSRIFGLATWKWPGLLITVLLTMVVMALSYRAQFVFTNRVRGKSTLKYVLTIVFPLIAMLAPLIFKQFAQQYLSVRGNPLYILGFAANLTALLAAVVVIFAASHQIAETIIASPRINPRGLNAQLIRISSQIISLFAAVILFLVGGQYLGFRVGALLASAGIGGIALALGAQDTLKTLFGTLSLMADKPFRVGDRIQFKTYDGFVEDIGLRSTKIRLLTGHLVTLPNDQLAGSNIENIGRRGSIRRRGEIHIPLDTPCEKVEKALAIVREHLVDHEGMDPTLPPRVFFDEFGEDAFILRFFYWFTPPDYWEFKAYGEKLNLAIFHAFEAEGIQFSLPSRHTMWNQDEGRGPSRPAS